MRLASLFVALAVLAIASTSAADDTCADAYREAQVARRDRQLLRALEQLKICAQPTCPEEAQRDCALWLTEVDAALPTMIVVVKKAGGEDVIGAKVSIDGTPVDGARLGQGIALDPGPHAVRAVLPGGAVLERDMVLVEGQKRQLVELIEPAPAPVPQPPPPPRESPGPHVSAWILGGVGLAGLGVFAGLAAWGYAGEGDLVEHGSTDEEIDDVRARYIGADVALAIGAAALVASAVVLIVWAASPDEATVSFGLGPGGALLRARY